MAALWDIVGKASNLVQFFGLDAVTVITIAMSFLRFHEIKKECRRLEECMQILWVLLHSPAGYWIMMQQQHLELGGEVTNALRDAHVLVESYNESSLFLRVRRARSMARQFRNLHKIIDSYCGLIISVNACLLIVQANPPPPSLVRTEVNDGAETSTTPPDDTNTINVSQE